MVRIWKDESGGEGHLWVEISVRKWPASNTGTCGQTGRSGKSIGFRKQSSIFVSFLDCMNMYVSAGICSDCINTEVPVWTA